MKNIYIYVLIDPITNQVRYVGKTNNKRTRYNNHLYQCRKFKDKRPLYCWMYSLMEKGLKPIFEVIEICNEDNWAKQEMFWIDHYRKNSKLTNISEGGEKWNGLTGEKIGTSKLTDLQVLEIRELLLKRYNTQYIANLYKVTKCTINDIKLGKTWQHLGEFKIEGKLNKITPEKAKIVLEMLKDGLSSRKIQKLTGVCRPIIKKIKDGKYS